MFLASDQQNEVMRKKPCVFLLDALYMYRMVIYIFITVNVFDCLSENLLVWNVKGYYQNKNKRGYCIIFFLYQSLSIQSKE